MTKDYWSWGTSELIAEIERLESKYSDHALLVAENAAFASHLKSKGYTQEQIEKACFANPF